MIDKKKKWLGWLLLCLTFFPAHQAMSTMTGATLVGGCPWDTDEALCGNSGNDGTANVAAILELAESLVTLDNSGASSELNVATGTWRVDAPPSEATHVAFKADGWFALFEIDLFNTDNEFMTNPDTWGDVFAGTVCLRDPGTSSECMASDFMQNGVSVNDLSHMNTYKVVPIPAAVWLFGSALLGLVGISRRNKQLIA